MWPTTLRRRVPFTIAHVSYHRRVLATASSRLLGSSFASFSTATSPSVSRNQDDNRLLVVGSGVAGSTAALIAAEIYKIPVTLLYAGAVPTDCNSSWAQGGIIYRNYCPTSNDSAELLAQDIHRAGAGLCQADAVDKVATDGPERVRQLLLNTSNQFANVPFDTRDDGTLSLCLEASHAAPRILHKADHTGRTITECLAKAVAKHPLIEQLPNRVVTDLIVADQNTTCVGVQVLNRTTGEISKVFATHGTVLCSGGLAGIYQHSTNPNGFNALGSSVALAKRAGAALQDLEYVQFHPTALNLPNESKFLISEALRGEGAILRNGQGRAFCRDYHPDGELAPRDIVARAVFAETQKSGCVYLDITHREADWVRSRFPSIQAHLNQRGLDLATDLLPVVPAAHYTCGGIATDKHGKTSLTGLFAAGEAARTGLHGGNRLASTSLLEGLVYGASVADFVGSVEGNSLHDQIVRAVTTIKQDRVSSPATKTSFAYSSVPDAKQRAVQLLAKVRETMWDCVGVIRTSSGLEMGLSEINQLVDEADRLHTSCPSVETAMVRDAAFAGQAVTEAAYQNKTSVGAHCILMAEDDEESDEEDQVDLARC
jgi:L-aspartate oxidase